MYFTVLKEGVRKKGGKHRMTINLFIIKHVYQRVKVSIVVLVSCVYFIEKKAEKNVFTFRHFA